MGRTALSAAHHGRSKAPVRRRYRRDRQRLLRAGQEVSGRSPRKDRGVANRSPSAMVAQVGTPEHAGGNHETIAAVATLCALAFASTAWAQDAKSLSAFSARGAASMSAPAA